LARSAKEVVEMNAIQFEAIIENNTIQIHERFKTSIHKDKVQVTIRDANVSENKNAMAWQRFLRGIKTCDNHESVEFERVNFDCEIIS
jgi:hypothetical protein